MSNLNFNSLSSFIFCLTSFTSLGIGVLQNIFQKVSHINCFFIFTFNFLRRSSFSRSSFSRSLCFCNKSLLILTISFSAIEVSSLALFNSHIFSLIWFCKQHIVWDWSSIIFSLTKWLSFSKLRAFLRYQLFYISHVTTAEGSTYLTSSSCFHILKQVSLLQGPDKTCFKFSTSPSSSKLFVFNMSIVLSANLIFSSYTYIKSVI